MRYVHGKFELHKASRRLYFDNELVPVGQLGIEILLFLIERNGGVASKSDLLEAVWPGEPANEPRLVKQVSLLRRAIESLPDGRSIVVTVPGLGYRTDEWVVTWPSAPPDQPTGQLPAQVANSGTSIAKETPTAGTWLKWIKGITGSSATDQPSGWRGSLRLYSRRAAVAVFFVLGLTYLFLSIVSQIEVHSRFGPSGIVRARTNQGFKRGLSFSRNGRMLAYYQSIEPDGAAQLLMVNLSDQSVIALPGRWNTDEEIAWSPDNRSIALLRSIGDDQARKQLAITSLNGHQVRAIGEVGAGGIDWAPNGQHFAVCVQLDEAGLPGSGSTLIHLLAADGSSRKQVTGNPTRGRVIDSRPRFSPDGSRLAFIRHHLGDQSLEIRLVDLARGEERQLFKERGEVFNLDWSPRGDELVFLSDRGGRQQLWRVSTVDRAVSPSPDLVTLIDDPIRSFSVSDAGELAYVSLPDTQSEIDLITLPGRLLDSLFHRRQGPGHVPCTICSSNSTYTPTFSPDGTEIAFISTQSGAEEIWVASANCTNYRQLTFLNLSGLNRLRWSGDGTRIAFDQRIDGQFDLFYLDLASGRIHRLTDTASDETTPVWSRNSGAIYYGWQSETVENQSMQIRRLDLTTNQTDLLVEESDGRLSVSPNQEQLYFTRQGWIWRINLETGEERREARLEETSSRASWELNHDKIYLMRQEGPSLPALFRYDLLSERLEKVIELDMPPAKSHPVFAISPNGQILANTSISPAVREIRFLKYPE